MEEIINDNFKGKIWNTTFGGDYCVLEIRDEPTRQVSFACINVFNGDVLWENIKPEKSWWLSLVGIFDEFLILHKYASNQKPEPEGLLILNVKSGEMVKRIDNWIFANFQHHILTIYQLQHNEPIYEIIDLSASSLDIKTILEKTPSMVEQSNNLTSATPPTHYPEDSPHFPTIYKFLYRLLNIDVVKAVDYLEISNKIIISYYIYRDKSFQNYLLVTNRAREILLNELIAETEGIGIDTFTVKSDTLLYVKNQTQFVGYRL
jgi:hypothetical protein